MCTFSDAITTTSCTGTWNQQAFGREHPHKVQISKKHPLGLSNCSCNEPFHLHVDNSCILFIILCAMCDVGYFGRKGTMNRPSVVSMTRIALYKCFILLPPNQGARRTTRVILRLEQPEKDKRWEDTANTATTHNKYSNISHEFNTLNIQAFYQSN